jgi:3' exoribonuclease, RNase T-like
MSEQVSLDIEACGEVVLSIGTCVFDPATGETSKPFYATLDPQAQIDRGLKMDGGAFLWWLMQSDAARKAVSSGQVSPETAFEALRSWWPSRDARTWCYPTSYDLPVLARAFAAFGIKPPWKWTETMCMRTLWKLACDHDPAAANIEKKSNPLAHDALADAQEQAGWCAAYLKAMRP